MIPLYKQQQNEMNSKVPMKNSSAQNTNKNLNNYTKTGIYYLGEDLTNSPINSYVKLFVMGTDASSSSGDSFQIAGGMTGQMYYRKGSLYQGNMIWSDWEQVASMKYGTWAPVLNTVEGAVPSIAYTSRYGNYRKIGNLVYVDFYIKGKITALTGTNNYAKITGLPFKTTNTRNFGEEGLNINVMYSLLENENNVGLVLGSNSNDIRIQCNYGTTADKLKVTPTNYFEIGGNGWYTTP